MTQWRIVGVTLGGNIGLQRPPQHRLPRLTGWNWAHRAVGTNQVIAALRPSGEPIGAIHLILIEQIGEALGELITATRRGIAARAGQKPAQWG